MKIKTLEGYPDWSSQGWTLEEDTPLNFEEGDIVRVNHPYGDIYEVTQKISPYKVALEHVLEMMASWVKYEQTEVFGHNIISGVEVSNYTGRVVIYDRDDTIVLIGQVINEYSVYICDYRIPCKECPRRIRCRPLRRYEWKDL